MPAQTLEISGAGCKVRFSLSFEGDNLLTFNIAREARMVSISE
jgi:hypothetical protein